MTKKISKKASTKKPVVKKNQEQNPEVAVTNPQCPKCGCTDRTKKENVRKRDINGKTRDGRRFSQVVWSSCTCKQCGQRYNMVEYLLPARQGDT